MSHFAHEILLVGLGEAGKTHLRSLEIFPTLNIVGVVDPAHSEAALFRGHELPVFSTIKAVSDDINPDVIVVATPTATHFDVCKEALESFPAADILVEKPAADNIRDALELLDPGNENFTVNVALHMAFSPEVIWGAELVQSVGAEIGVPISIMSWSADSYQKNLPSARTRLDNSWIDSGINSLSVIERFVTPVERRSLRQLGEASWSTFEGRFTCEFDGGLLEASVLTNWHATDASRSTRIRYSSGAELVLDHHAVTGCLVRDGRVARMFGSDGDVPRRDTHYRTLYRWWLVDHRPVFSRQAVARLHELLLRPNEGDQRNVDDVRPSLFV